MQYLLPQKAKGLEGGALRTEAANRSGQTWVAGLTVGYQVAEAVKLKLHGELRMTDASDLRSGARPYNGKRQKYMVGADLSYKLTKAILLESAVSYFGIEKDQGVTLPSNQTTTGWKSNIRLVYAF
jgi:hypothetical protein